MLNKSNVSFVHDTHQYFLDGKELYGITSTLIPAIFGDYTDGIPQDTLQRAAERGTLIHQNIELIDAWDGEPTFYEVEEYVKLRDMVGLKPLTSEYIVTDGEHFASPIDKVYEGDIIADIKTTAKLHYEQVCFQLSWYATYYQKMNDRPVQKAYIVWLPKPQYGRCEVMEVELVAPEVIEDIVAHYLNMEDVSSFAPLFAKRSATLPATVQNAVTTIINQESKIKELDTQLKTLKEQRELLNKVLIEYFIATGEQKIILADMTFTYIPPTTRVSVDTKGLKEQYPDLFAKFRKESVVRESIRLTTNKGGK